MLETPEKILLLSVTAGTSLAMIQSARPFENQDGGDIRVSMRLPAWFVRAMPIGIVASGQIVAMLVHQEVGIKAVLGPLHDKGQALMVYLHDKGHALMVHLHDKLQASMTHLHDKKFSIFQCVAIVGIILLIRLTIGMVLSRTTAPEAQAQEEGQAEDETRAGEETQADEAKPWANRLRRSAKVSYAE